jgi:hypothetical protein
MEAVVPLMALPQNHASSLPPWSQALPNSRGGNRDPGMSKSPDAKRACGMGDIVAAGFDKMTFHTLHCVSDHPGITGCTDSEKDLKLKSRRQLS